MIVALRFTREGSICSGDNLYDKTLSEYYMTNEGMFVIFIATQEIVQVVLYYIFYKKVNAQRPVDINIFKTYISPSMHEPYSKATQVILDQLKFS